MPGSFCSSATVDGNLPPWSSATALRAFVQVARAAVVAKPRPGGEHVVERRRGQRLDGRPAGKEAQVEGDDGFDRRLLQHDLAEPDAVGVGALARRHAPGQVAALLVVPGEQRVDRVGTGRPKRQLLSRNSSQGIVSRRPRIDPPMVSVETARWKLSTPDYRTMATNAATFRRPGAAPAGNRHGRPRGFISARAVGTYVPKLTHKAFEKYGFAAAALITDWAMIVGKDVAAYTAPERLKWPRGVGIGDDVEDGAEGRPGATLIVRVDPARALDVQYKAQQMHRAHQRPFRLPRRRRAAHPAGATARARERRGRAAHPAAALRRARACRHHRRAAAHGAGEPQVRSDGAPRADSR